MRDPQDDIRAARTARTEMARELALSVTPERPLILAAAHDHRATVRLTSLGTQVTRTCQGRAIGPASDCESCYKAIMLALDEGYLPVSKPQ